MIRMRARWPTLNAPVSDQNLVLLANDEVISVFWPWLLASQGDYYTSSLDRPVTANKSRYRLPINGFGPIKDAMLVDTAGKERSLSFCNLAEVGKGDISSDHEYTAFIDGELLGLTPTPSRTDGTILRMRYYRKPNTMWLTDATHGLIDRIILSMPTATRAVISDAGTTYQAGIAVDVISQGSGHQVVSESLLVLAADAATLTTRNVDANYPDTVEVGDTLMLAGRTPFVQLPDFMVPLLSTRVAMLGLDIEGDEASFSRKAKLADELQKLAVGALEPRYEGEPRMTQPRGTPHRPGR